MANRGHRSRSAGAHVVLALATSVWLAGCATPVPAPSPRQDPPVVTSRAAVAPEIVPEGIPEAVPEVGLAIDSGHRTAFPVLVHSVAILYSGSKPTQASIAELIGAGLSSPDYTIRHIDIDNPGVKSRIGAAPRTHTDIVAAVGPDALDVALQRFIGTEIVFSQVLEPAEAATTTRTIRGVAPVPPADLQFAAWAEVDSNLKRIGLITSENFARGVSAAEQAAAAIGAELVHRVSTSDRETLYLFRRLAGEIDGLWLAPDSAVLSTTIIEELLAHAAERKIGVLVFSESLLAQGGLISVTADSENIAGTVIGAIEQIRVGQASYLPAEIPLTEAAVQINARVADDLGLPPRWPIEWTNDAGQ